MFGRYFKVWNQLIQIDFRKEEIGNVCSPKDSNYQLEVMRRKQKAIHIIQNLRGKPCSHSYNRWQADIPICE